MCGRYGRRADKQRIAEWFHTHNTDVFNDEYYEINSTRLAPSYNISPESIQPVVRLDHDTGERVLAFMKWGMVPYWSKTPKANFSSINARSDKLENSGAWREPWKHRRCLIPASFFFEWEPLSKEEEKKKLSKPWAVSLADDQLFAFGGIWDRWKGENSEKNEIVVESFSIITTDPKEVLIKPFHNRCPLIIEPKNFERWLAPAQPSHLPIDLVRTFPAEEMKAWQVAKIQGNGPELTDLSWQSSDRNATICRSNTVTSGRKCRKKRDGQTAFRGRALVETCIGLLPSKVNHAWGGSAETGRLVKNESEVSIHT